MKGLAALCFSAVLIQCVLSNVKDDTFAMKFLDNFGYLSPFSRSGNHDTTAAIKKYQEYMGLPVTGELDPVTLEEMKKKRCGNRDVEDKGTRVRRYELSWRRWRKFDLKYYIKFGDDTTNQEQINIFANAFGLWQKVIPKFTFTRTLDPKQADFKLSFGWHSHWGIPGEQKCGSSFDNWYGTLAHAYYPPDGRIHFDEYEWWHPWHTSILFRQSLAKVALHEIGHALGLGHSKVKDSVMWPTCCRGDYSLHKDDIDGIKRLYGY